MAMTMWHLMAISLPIFIEIKKAMMSTSYQTVSTKKSMKKISHIRKESSNNLTSPLGIELKVQRSIQVEGINNFIKVIKRTAYGLSDFNRFRSRILFPYNKDYTLSA